MGTCKYCGEKAGLLSRAHKECEQKHEAGLVAFSRELELYFQGRESVADVMTMSRQLRRDNFLSDADTATVVDTAVKNYSDGLRRPYSPRSMHLVADIMGAFHLPMSQGVEEFAKKLMRGFMVDYFTDNLPLAQAQQRCQSVLRRFPISVQQQQDAYWHVLDRAATNFIADGNLTDAEHRKIEDYTHSLGLQLNNVPAPYQNGDISRLSQVAIIKALEHGVVPHTNIQAPIILGKKEQVLWVYNGVNLYQEKIVREWRGRSSGFSIPIYKGIRYRTGGMRGRPIEHSTMQHEGYGSLYITTKNLIFWSPQKSVKLPFTKIVGFTPYSDGLEVHRDAPSAKRLALQGFDPWLIMNISPYLTSL